MRRTQRFSCRAAATVLVGAALGLSGCTVGPDYHAPEYRGPDSYAHADTPGTTTRPAARPDWWRTLNDPTLDRLVDRAVAGNLDVREAQARVREARAARGIIAADLWPTIDALAAYTHRRRSGNDTPRPDNSATIARGIRLPNLTVRPNLENPAAGPTIGLTPGTGGQAQPQRSPQPPLEQSLYQVGFDATWEIDVFGAVRRDVEAAAAEIEAAIENRNNVVLTLLAEVARNYVELRGLQRRLQVAENNIQIQQDSVDLAESRFQAGLTGELDVAQARAQLAATQSQVPAFEEGIARAAHRLAVLLGMPPAALIDELFSHAPLPTTPPEVPVGLPSDLLLRRPDIRQAERELAAATARIGAATAELFPRFTLTGRFGLESAYVEDLFDWRSRAWSVGPGVRWPVFDGWRIRSNIEVQNARQEQAVARYERTVLNAFEEVESALVAYDREKARYERLAEAVDANRRAVELSNELYSRGLTNFLNVIESQRSLYSSEDQFILSEQTVVANLIALYKALGGGWEFQVAVAPPPDVQTGP